MIKPHLQDDAFLADVAEPLADSAELRLWWLGQSGYLVKWDGGHFLIDPYLSDSLTHKYAGTDKPHVRISERVIAPERLAFVDAVTSSHNHTDHLDAGTLKPLLAAKPNLDIVVPAANRVFAADRLGVDLSRLIAAETGDYTAAAGTTELFAVPAAHPTRELDERHEDRFVGYVFDLDGSLVVYHSGDTMVYDDMATWVNTHKIDVAILPINGKVGNMNGRDAARLAKDIGARLVIPCHYDMFEFNTADPYEEFVPECEKIGQPYRVLKLGERWSSSEL